MNSAKPRTTEDLRVMILTQTAEKLREELNAEINRNARLQEEIDMLRRQGSVDMGRG